MSDPEAGKWSASTNEQHKIWLIDEGHAGHRVQAEGILQALAKLGLNMNVTTIKCEPRLRGSLRPAAKAIFHRLRGQSALHFAARVSSFSVPDDGPPRFIISSGGRTAFLSRALSLATGAPNVFVGNLGQFPPNWFTVVMSPIDLKTPNSIMTRIVPNTMTPDDCHEHSQRYWNNEVPERCWTLLIGGANRNHRFCDQDWRAVAAGVNALSERFGVKWLIATSRRTGFHVERLLEEAIVPSSVEELVLFSQNPKKVVMAFLGAAEIVFVTQDSLTMMGEAIASGRRVVSLSPQNVNYLKNSYGYSVIRNYNNFPQVSNLDCLNMSKYWVEPGSSPNYANSMKLIGPSVKLLISRLGIAWPEPAVGLSK